MSTLHNFELEVSNLAERITFNFGNVNTIQHQRKLQLKAAIAASVMVFLSPVAGIGWMRYYQEQLRSQVQEMVSQIPNLRTKYSFKFISL